MLAILVNDDGKLFFADSDDLSHICESEGDATYRIAWTLGPSALRLFKAYGAFIDGMGVTEEEFGLDVVFQEIFRAGIEFAHRDFAKK